MRAVSCGITDIGLKRERNEDAFLINEELGLYVLCDGMGGHAGGEFASAIAATTVEDVFTEIELDGQMYDAEEDPIEITRTKLAQAVRSASARIFETAAQFPNLRSMGTTAVVLLLREQNAFIGHVGDSRLYLLRDGQLEQVTDDHSFVARGVREGLLTPEEARNHPMRNVITRSLGSHDTVEVDVQVRAMKRGDRFLLCSDGLSGMLEDDRICELLREGRPRDAARSLVENACENGGDDNVTVVIVAVESAA